MSGCTTTETTFGRALANVQAYVWPQMGNARRFSSG